MSTAILLVILIGFLGLGIDVAIWYTRSLQVQRTADAAALAGVTQMPKFQAAENAAVEAASRNGFASTDVVVERVTDSPREVRVTVKDDSVPSVFSRVFGRGGTKVVRSARAEFISEIELGSKLNALGTGNIPGLAQGFWLAINGACTSKEFGDRFASAFERTRTSTGSVCNSTINNKEYPGDYSTNKPPAYTYNVEIPCATPAVNPCVTTSAVNIDAWHPYFDPSNNGIDTNMVDPADGAPFDLANITTTFHLFDDNGNAIGVPKSYGTCPMDYAIGCPTANAWYTAFTIPAGSPTGRYRLEVNTLAYNAAVPTTAHSFGSNAFSLIAYSTATGRALCNTSACPSLSGARSMSVYTDVQGSSADFYLAKLAPAKSYRGKRIQILLWDPDEGAESIQILAPDALVPAGVPVGFLHRTWSPGLEVATVDVDDFDKLKGPTAAPLHKLDVSGPITALPGADQPPWAATDRVGQQRYNGRLVSLELTIPTNYGCVPASSPCQETPLPNDGWWKIRYNTGSTTVSDRTTWTVQLVGDPVHLSHD